MMAEMATIAQGAEALGPAIGPWANLTAVATLIGLCVWIITKYIPGLMATQEKERTSIASVERSERTQQRADFVAEMNEQRRDFLTALAKRDEMTETAISAGRQSIDKLADTVGVLSTGVDRLNDSFASHLEVHGENPPPNV